MLNLIIKLIKIVLQLKNQMLNQHKKFIMIQYINIISQNNSHKKFKLNNYKHINIKQQKMKIKLTLHNKPFQFIKICIN
jgi:hypothetical protein